jgi:hypothetical protein
MLLHISSTYIPNTCSKPPVSSFYCLDPSQPSFLACLTWQELKLGFLLVKTQFCSAALLLLIQVWRLFPAVASHL